MDFTPNRGDCLSLNGLLRDLSFFFELKNDLNSYSEPIEKFEFNFKNKYPEFCPYISFLRIKIKSDIKPYKSYLNDYFNDLKINKNNFFTDISNYLLFENGQPTHCYDSSKLGGKLVLDINDKPLNFKTIVGDEIELFGEDLVFTNETEIVNLAGVMGGESTSCSIDTTDVIVESAYFNPEIVIGKTIKYDIKSDAAYRFERGVDPKNQEATLRRFISIVEDHAEIIELKLFNFINKEFFNTKLNLDIKTINNILGTQVSETKYVDYIRKLGFECIDNKVIVPSFRSDVSQQNDLAEELARLIGYNNIENSKLHINKPLSKISETCEEKVKKVLVDNGFNEVINYPFEQKSNTDSITVDNPLDKNKRFLRQSLESSLINNLLMNERRQKDSIKLFEISDLYSFNTELSSIRKIGIIATGKVGKNYQDFAKIISQEYLSNIIELFLKKGKFEIKKIPRDSLDTKIKSEIFYAEAQIIDINKDILNFETNSQYPKDYILYKEISEYPFSVRDISLSIKEYDQLKPLEQKILSYKHEILKEIFVFDFFENIKNKELKIGFRFIFQSQKRTLTDNEIENVLNDIIDDILSFNGIDIPGLDRKWLQKLTY